MTILEQLKLLLRLSGLTQEALAKRLGVSFVAFNAWVNNRAKPRAGAQQRIRSLLATYGLADTSSDPLGAAKQALAWRAQSQKNIIPAILGQPDIRDEFILALTYHSNVIEGSTLTKGETAAVLFDDEVLKNRTLREQMEAKNHQTAVEFLFHTIKPGEPIRESFILRLHAILLNGIQSDAGKYRNSAVRIVGANVPTANPASVRKRMTALMADINRQSADSIARVAGVHADFEQIHPFTDGNGRVGRLLMNAMLLKRNFAPAIIEQRRKGEYLKYLNRAQLHKDIEPLERFLSEAVLVGWAILDRRRGA